MKIMIFPEGPIAHNGTDYCYSKGERLYLERLASAFEELIIVSYVFRSGDEHYEGCAHSAFSSKNIKVIELPLLRKANYGVFSKIIQFTKVFSIILRNCKNIDVVYLFLPSFPSAFAWVAARWRSIPHIVYGADDWEQATPGMFKWPRLKNSWFYSVYAKLSRWLEKRICSTALFAVAAGGAIVNKYRSFNIPAFETTPRITLTRDDIYQRHDTCQKEVIKLLSIGGLIYDKAQHLLIEAFAKIYANNPRVRLTIVGNGPRLDELQQLCKQLNVADFVEFKGYVKLEKELYEIYRTHDIFVLSSVSEGFPRVLYESMANSIPIVTSDCGGITSKMHNQKNALIVKTGDVNQLADAINTVITNPQLRQQIIAGGSQLIDKVMVSWDPMQIYNLVQKYADSTT